MTLPKTEKVEVIQADRDAAADFLAADWTSNITAEHVRRGLYDGDEWVQAFARHRTTDSSPVGEGEVEARELERLITEHLRRLNYRQMDFVLSGDGGYECTYRTWDGYAALKASLDALEAIRGLG